MWRHFRSFSAGFIALGMLTIATTVQADSPAPPRSYKKFTPGNEFVFVMISPLPIEEDVRRWNEETAAGIREVRRVYPRSGMYRNDGSVEPLWTVDWYAYGIELTHVGVYLIRPGPGAVLPEDRKAALGSALDQEALSFFANGQLVRTYRIGELVDDPDRLPRSASHFMWQDEGWVSGDGSEYTLTTLDGNRFVFDVRTGAIVSESRTGRLSGWVWWVALGIVAVGVVGWYVWKYWTRALEASA